ncbi:MAG: GntR family transcriptional regulator [Clostridia bacterium]|nr:GntR family transcriptional regulator [Clostridia bacterium]
MINIDWKSGVPAYDQIVSGFIRLKAVGAMGPGEQLPSVRSLAMQLGVNPNTVQKAYFILEEKGIIFSVAGKGSFISEGEEAEKAIKASVAAAFEKAVNVAFRHGLDLKDVNKILEKVYKEGGKND